MKKIISALVVSSLLLAGQALAADGIVFDGGDVRIKQGSGGALVFQDGTTQTTATLKGDKGDQGIQGIQGPKGDKGDPGVANGISKGVHGTVVGANVPSNSNIAVPGTGFYVNRTTTDSVGTYKITFSPAFSTPPDCVISPVGHLVNYTTQNAYVDCQLSPLVAPYFSAQRATVECRYYYNFATPQLIDDTFTFICVK
jgi:hypothetical protein